MKMGRHSVSLSLSACTYKNQECRLAIHYDNGFSITTEPQDGAFAKTIIQAPYEKLKMSSDDGIRMLYLDFGGKDGEIVSALFFRKGNFVHRSMQHTHNGSKHNGALHLSSIWLLTSSCRFMSYSILEKRWSDPIFSVLNFGLIFH